MVKIGGEGQITSREAGMHKIPSTDRISTSGRTFEKLILLTHSLSILLLRNQIELDSCFKLHETSCDGKVHDLY